MRPEQTIRDRLAELRQAYDLYLVENAGRIAADPEAWENTKSRYEAAIWNLEWVLGERP